MARTLSGKDLSPCNEAVRLLNVERSDQRIVVTAESKAAAACPTCGSLSTSQHSRYWRTLKDLPVQGVPVVIRLRLSRWRCRNRDCGQTIFTQRLATVAAPSARRTSRFDEMVLLVGHSLGGRPAEKVMSRLGMPASNDTLLRRVKRSAAGVGHTLRVVGVDDWAWKKQHNYGTILVDLERGETVDLPTGTLR